jgi:iron complex outermembrane receptor protein
LDAAGLSAAQSAEILASLVGSSLNDFPLAIVLPDQPILQEGEDLNNSIPILVNVFNYGKVDYWGIDASLEFLASDRYTFYTNFSFVSDDFFDTDEVGSDNPDFQLALNAPRFKFKFGGEMRVSDSFSINMAGRYIRGFPVRAGLLTGRVDPYFILDAGIGHDFGSRIPGLRLDAMVQNVLNNEHREFVGAPRIGRLALIRLSYTIE